MRKWVGKKAKGSWAEDYAPVIEGWVEACQELLELAPEEEDKLAILMVNGAITKDQWEDFERLFLLKTKRSPAKLKPLKYRRERPANADLKDYAPSTWEEQCDDLLEAVDKFKDQAFVKNCRSFTEWTEAQENYYRSLFSWKMQMEPFFTLPLKVKPPQSHGRQRFPLD